MALLVQTLYHFLIVALIVRCGNAALHRLFIGSPTDNAKIYSLGFDDAAHTLNLIKDNSNAVGSPHPYLAFDSNKRNIYAAGANQRHFHSYSVLDGSTLEWDHAVDLPDKCQNTTAGFVVANQWSPRWVYVSAYPGSCGAVIGIEEDGQLTDLESDLYLSSESGITGMAFSPNSYFLYSVDLDGEAIFVHLNEPTDGFPIEYLHRQETPAGSRPSSVLCHKMGQSLYVAFQGTNQLAVYNLHNGIPDLSQTFPLAPEGQSDAISSTTRKVSIALSASNSLLWVLSSSDSERLLTSLALDSMTGNVQGQLFQARTSMSEGVRGYSISTSPGSDDWIAITSIGGSGSVEIWQWLTSANNAVLHAAWTGGKAGCCGQALWYD